MRLINRADLSDERIANLERELENQKSLADVLHWALSDKLGAFAPGVVSRVVVQDEFTHDVVVPYENICLVYGAT